MSQFLEPTWNKPVKEYDRALDPLGMNRVNDRMIGELVQGFTLLTSRARYYSFYVWAIEQINKKKLAKNFTEFKNAFYDLERIYMMTCVSHEEKELKDNHKDINGSGTGRNIWNENSEKIPLNFTYFGHRLGGYGQYYQGSILNLGLIEQGDDDEFEKPSNLGYSIIKKFDVLAKESKFLSYYGKSNISKKELSKMGEKICLCSIKKQSNSERDELIDLFFGMIGEKNKRATSRKESLSLILSIIEQIQENKITLSQDFLDSIYFDQVKNNKNTIKITIPNSLQEIRKKWKIVKAHDNFALASESILQMLLQFLEQDNIHGKNIEEFYQKNILKINDEIKNILKIEGYFTVKPLKEILKEILKENNINDDLELIDQSKKYDEKIKISSKINEQLLVENIEELIDSNEPIISKTLVNSILLVFLTGFRFSSIVDSETTDIKWFKRLEKNDVGVLEFTKFVSEQIKQNVSFEEFTRNFIQKFVISQAETIFKDKIRSSTNPKCWFHKEGANYFKDRDYWAKHRNIRFPSAISLLHDLDLVQQTDESLKCTPKSTEILKETLQ